MYQIEKLYMQYKKDIYLYFMSLTQDHTLSEDLLSETFVKAIKSLPTFRGQSTVKTWLFGIAKNTWLQHLRSCRKTVEYDELLEVYVNYGLDELIISKEKICRIKEFLQKKDERTRKIVSMRVEGVPYSEIAEKLHISESSARVIDYRVKQGMKNELKKKGYL